MKLMKRSASIILAVLMLLPCCNALFVTAADDEYDHLPQVYVTGFASANIYYENDPDKKPLFAPIDTERILGNLNNLGKYALDSIKKGNPDLLYSCVYSFVWDSFGMLRLNPDGSMPEGVAVEETTLSYDGDGKYTFYYDSRFSPVDVAHQLHDYIALVKEDSGSDKIELVGSSYGADVVSAYLNEYKNDLDDLDSVILCVPSVGGVSWFGELLSGELNVDPIAVKNFIDGQLAQDEVSLFLSILDKSGALDTIVNAALVPVLREALFDAILDIGRDVIATIPAVWVCVQDEYFEPALKNMFGENYADPNHEYADLIADMTYYHENIMLRADDIIVEAKRLYPDMEISIICKYGKPAIPISKNSQFMEDGFAALDISSYGATCALYGEQLPADYIQAAYPENNFLSPDGSVDASTCLIPFNTWFIKGLGHSQKNEDYWKLIDAIAYGDLDVFENPDYPQFLELSSEDAERLIPNQPVEPVKETGIFEDFMALIIRLITLVIGKLSSMFLAK